MMQSMKKSSGSATSGPRVLSAQSSKQSRDVTNSQGSSSQNMKRVPFKQRNTEHNISRQSACESSKSQQLIAS